MALISQHFLAANPLAASDSWWLDAYAEIQRVLCPPSEFPCVFSQNAFKRELLLFSFVENAKPSSLDLSADDLLQYLRLCESWDGSINSASPLLVVFSLEAAQFATVDKYQEFGWSILRGWHDRDEAPWPAGVSRDPHFPFWSMCFAGTQIFVNMSSPAHQVRRSRNLGKYFVFVVNPRERFDLVAGDNPDGRKIRHHIRNRIAAYDGVSHCQQLGSYQAGELEWWQYGIIEQNAERFDRCPFDIPKRQEDADADRLSTIAK